MDEPERVTDAEFTVINGPTEPAPIVSEQPPPRRWWQGWYINWQTALLVGALSATTAATRCQSQHVNASSPGYSNAAAVAQP